MEQPLPTWQERAQWLDEFTSSLVASVEAGRGTPQALVLFAHARETEERLRATAWPRSLEFRSLIVRARATMLEAQAELIAQYGLKVTDHAFRAMATAEAAAATAELAPFRSEREAHLQEVVILMDLVAGLGPCAQWSGWQNLPEFFQAMKRVPRTVPRAAEQGPHEPPASGLQAPESITTERRT